MTHVARNVVNDVLRCLVRCEALQASIARLPARHADAVELQQQAADAFQQMEIDLCDLVSSFIGAPMSGRMFLPLPPEYVSADAAQESLHAQLLEPRA